jgi:hypothetical protein
MLRSEIRVSIRAGADAPDVFLPAAYHTQGQWALLLKSRLPENRQIIRILHVVEDNHFNALLIPGEPAVRTPPVGTGKRIDDERSAAATKPLLDGQPQVGTSSESSKQAGGVEKDPTQRNLNAEGWTEAGVCTAVEMFAQAMDLTLAEAAAAAAGKKKTEAGAPAYTKVEKILGDEKNKGEPYVVSILKSGFVDPSPPSGFEQSSETHKRELLRRILQFVGRLRVGSEPAIQLSFRKADEAARCIGKLESRGTLSEDGQLQPTANHFFDVTQELLDHGVLLPEHVPIVCPSFAGIDLAKQIIDGTGNAENHRSGVEVDRDGCDEIAGHDAWGICDYLRDALLWPTESIFIDNEAFGDYHQPSGDREPPRLYLHRNRQFNVHVVDEGNDKSHLIIKRNYRKVYQWAQRVSPVAILFISKEWVKSDNCTNELDDLIVL